MLLYLFRINQDHCWSRIETTKSLSLIYDLDLSTNNIYSLKKVTQHDLNNGFDIFTLLLKYNIYINLKLVQFPIKWWVKLFL